MEATEGISKRLSLPSSVHSVMSNDDLLIEILIRLPVLSILDFKIVSKHWLSIIKNPSFTLRRSKTIVDPPSALVIKQYFSSRYEILSLDIRMPAVKTAFPFCNIVDHELKFVILHACNGLFLCRTKQPWNYYVYNPTINKFKLLPPCYDSVCIIGVKMAFDPAKSPHYKVIWVGDDIDCSLRIYTYSSETGNWSRHPSSHYCFLHFGFGVYWNDAIYWYHNYYKQCVVKLDVDSLNLSTMVLPVGILKEKGTIDRDHKLFESRGCLLLVCSGRVNDIDDTWLLKVYEMTDDARSEWSVKYIVELDDVMMLIPTTWKKSAVRFTVLYIEVGEREEDSFLVIEVFGKVMQYKIMLKTLVMLFDTGPVPPEVRQLVERPGVCHMFSCFPLIASFAGV